MIKKAQYWREFTAATRDEAKKAADAWWAQQSGFDRVSGWVLPASEPPPDGATGWTATIIYRPSSGQEAQRPTIH